MTPSLRGFGARRTKLSDRKYFFDVSGEVQLTGISGIATLTLMEPQGILPATIMLEIEVLKNIDSVGFSQFHQSVCWANESSFKHDLIDLFWKEELIHTFPILED